MNSHEMKKTIFNLTTREASCARRVFLAAIQDGEKSENVYYVGGISAVSKEGEEDRVVLRGPGFVVEEELDSGVLVCFGERQSFRESIGLGSISLEEESAAVQ